MGGHGQIQAAAELTRQGEHVGLHETHVQPAGAASSRARARATEEKSTPLTRGAQPGPHQAVGADVALQVGKVKPGHVAGQVRSGSGRLIPLARMAISSE
jgi:hypothetical protein